MLYILYFFDFDRTLCAHGYPVTGEPVMSYYEECLTMFTREKELFSKDKPLKCMKWFIDTQTTEDDELFCITHEIFNLRDEYKKSFLKKHYREMTYFTVDTAEHKIDLILALCKARNIPPSEVYLIDDKMSTIHLACQAGINGIHVSNIYALYEENN